MFNTREGIPARDDIDMHDDEPIENPEHLMDDSSQSGSDGEETEEDKRNMRETLKRAEAAKVQLNLNSSELLEFTDADMDRSE